MNHYYSDDLVTIYHGDARDWTANGETVLVTDPPYGVSLGASDSRGGGHGLAKAGYANYDDNYLNFCTVVVPVIENVLRDAVRGAVFVGPHYREMPKATAIGGIYCPSAVGRHPWGFATFLTILFYGKDPTMNVGPRSMVLHSTARAEANGHPVPKPLEWMLWLVARTSQPLETVFDPFMGSGTTLVASKVLGRKSVGIEIDERYCEIAANRCRQEVLGLSA